MALEPIQGRAGSMFPRDNFSANLRTCCDKRGIMPIYDELLCSMRRMSPPIIMAEQVAGKAMDIIDEAVGGSEAELRYE